MDWFKFTNPNSPTRMEGGDFIPNTHISSKMWAERYREAGEFSIEASVDSGLREYLPVGTPISHMDTDEIMVVENHEIPEEPDEDSKLTITGRSYETFLEQRVVGSNREFPVGAPISPFALASGKTWNQVVSLIEFHTMGDQVVNPKDAIPYLDVVTTAYGLGVEEGRTVKFGELYPEVLELMEINDLGLTILRPRGVNPNMTLVIHRGANRAKDVIFSHGDDVESSDYLWSNKAYKNCALVTGKWVSTVVDDVGASGINRRMMSIDGADIDDRFDSFPTGEWLTWTKDMMRARARRVLAKARMVALQKANVFKESQGAQYRTDYKVGDLVTVEGKYDSTRQVRIGEYVLIEDEEGTQGFPSFVDL